MSKNKLYYTENINDKLINNIYDNLIDFIIENNLFIQNKILWIIKKTTW